MDKPKSCKNGCPPFQTCDFCAGKPDDLVKRLRDLYGANVEEFQTIGEAADRIESQMQLIGASGEVIGTMLARIEKMEEALRRISDDGNWGPDGCWDAASYPDEIARVALGEEEEDDV